VALLLVIYLAFVSLGLPDGVLGSAWPSMHAVLGLPLWSAGLLSILVSLGTVCSALLSGRMIGRFGTFRVTAASVLLTALALLGFSVATGLPVLLLLCVPLGLGGGSVDAALNNYVALHYGRRHMNWLHACWGIGASAGPAIMATGFSRGFGYRHGYWIIGSIQMALMAFLLLTRSLWARNGQPDGGKHEKDADLPLHSLPGVPFALLSFFLYCSMEVSTGLWATTFLVEARQLPVEQAALWGSLFFLGITVGRIAGGLVSTKGNANGMIGGGLSICFVSACLLSVPLPTLDGIALLLFGIGCAPLFPTMIALTPKRFGAASSRRIIGFQMACAYVGSMAMPPVVGLMADGIGLSWLPPVLLLFVVALSVCAIRLAPLSR
jgi:fucose permease